MTNILFFSAQWCQPCKSMEAVLRDMLPQFPNLKVIKVDIEKDTDTAKLHNVKSVPLLVAGGRRLEGGTSKSSIRQFLNEVSKC